jgi:hypothetical protein
MNNFWRSFSLLAALLVGFGWYSDSSTQRELKRLTAQINELAPVGAHRIDVEQALSRIPIEHVYGKSDNALYGQKHVGHYRLIYRTIFIYKIQLDENGDVLRVATTFLNEGL